MGTIITLVVVAGLDLQYAVLSKTKKAAREAVAVTVGSARDIATETAQESSSGGRTYAAGTEKT